MVFFFRFFFNEKRNALSMLNMLQKLKKNGEGSNVVELWFWCVKKQELHQTYIHNELMMKSSVAQNEVRYTVELIKLWMKQNQTNTQKAHVILPIHKSKLHCIASLHAP